MFDWLFDLWALQSRERAVCIWSLWGGLLIMKSSHLFILLDSDLDLGCFNISHYDQRVTGIHNVLVPLYKNASSPKECHTPSALLSMAVSKDMGTRGCFKGSRKATTSIKVQGGLRIPVGIPRYLRFNAMTENDNPVYPIIHPFFQSLDPCIRALSWCDTHSNAWCTWKIACARSCIVCGS